MLFYVSVGNLPKEARWGFVCRRWAAGTVGVGRGVSISGRKQLQQEFRIPEVCVFFFVHT